MTGSTEYRTSYTTASFQPANDVGGGLSQCPQWIEWIDETRTTGVMSPCQLTCMEISIFSNRSMTSDIKRFIHGCGFKTQCRPWKQPGDTCPVHNAYCCTGLHRSRVTVWSTESRSGFWHQVASSAPNPILPASCYSTVVLSIYPSGRTRMIGLDLTSTSSIKVDLLARWIHFNGQKFPDADVIGGMRLDSDFSFLPLRG